MKRKKYEENDFLIFDCNMKTIKIKLNKIKISYKFIYFKII